MDQNTDLPVEVAHKRLHGLGERDGALAIRTTSARRRLLAALGDRRSQVLHAPHDLLTTKAPDPTQCHVSMMPHAPFALTDVLCAQQAKA